MAPATARAQTNCADIVGENKTIYGTGGSSIREALRRVGAALRAHDTLLLFSDGGGACVGFADYVAGTAPAARPYRYWTAEAVESTCIAPEAVPEFAYLPHPVEECADASLPEGIKDFRGPVESANLLTDIDSDYDSISAEAWKFLLLHGPSASGIAPWTEDNGLIIRDRATFVHVFVSKLVDGQTCGYWPDSDQYSTDRRNVRNGLYAIWTPGHFFAEVDEEGDVARAATTASVSSIETAEQPRQRAWPSERA